MSIPKITSWYSGHCLYEWYRPRVGFRKVLTKATNYQTGRMSETEDDHVLSLDEDVAEADTPLQSDDEEDLKYDDITCQDLHTYKELADEDDLAWVDTNLNWDISMYLSLPKFKKICESTANDEWSCAIRILNSAAKENKLGTTDKPKTKGKYINVFIQVWKKVTGKEIMPRHSKENDDASAVSSVTYASKKSCKSIKEVEDEMEKLIDPLYIHRHIVNKLTEGKSQLQHRLIQLENKYKHYIEEAEAAAEKADKYKKAMEEVRSKISKYEKTIKENKAKCEVGINEEPETRKDKLSPKQDEISNARAKLKPVVTGVFNGQTVVGFSKKDDIADIMPNSVDK